MATNSNLKSKERLAKQKRKCEHSLITYTSKNLAKNFNKLPKVKCELARE